MSELMKALLDYAKGMEINLAAVVVLIFALFMARRLSQNLKIERPKTEVRMTTNAADELISRLHRLEEDAQQKNKELAEVRAEIAHIRGVLRGRGFPLDN